VLRVCLSAVADGRYGAFDGKGAAECEAAGEGLRFQEVGEDAGVGCEAGEGEAEMFVDGYDLLLI
jgi:hypothetical protein